VVANPLGSIGSAPLLKLRIPASALPGTHWFTAIGRISGAAARATFLVATDWAEFGFDARNRRYNPYENVVNTANVGSLDLLWASGPQLGPVMASPSVVTTVSNSVFIAVPGPPPKVTKQFSQSAPLALDPLDLGYVEENDEKSTPRLYTASPAGKTRATLSLEPCPFRRTVPTDRSPCRAASPFTPHRSPMTTPEGSTQSAAAMNLP